GKAPLGEIWASPVLAGENIFVGSADGNFYSVDSQTGKVIWSVTLGARVESTACIVDGIAYLGNDLGTLFAVNIKNGSMLWKKSLGEYIRSSPICEAGELYTGTISPSRKSGTLYKLNASDGSIGWKRPMGAVFGSPLY